MPCFGNFSIYPEPLCQHECPRRPGVRCERVAHPRWEGHVGGGESWPGEGAAPPLTRSIGSREGTDRAFEQDGARYDYDRGRESWRPAGDDRMHWWVR